MTKLNLRFAWYSNNAAKLYGTHIYQTADGREVEVTGVQLAAGDTRGYQWSDQVAVGFVTNWVRKGRVGSHE